MKNCIFICVFNNENYIKMFYILLESLYIYGNLNDNTDILLYTSTSFMNIIKNHYLYNKNICFEINDTYDNIDKACKARLDIFNLESINNYSKILYLDTDILIKNDINKVFDIIKEDILYVLEEGYIDDSLDKKGNKPFEPFCSNDCWGCLLFDLNNELDNYEDKSAFTSGILLFNNCEKIKDLFNKINEHINSSPYKFGTYDQPYIIYNAFKYNLYNNKLLKDVAANNSYNMIDNIVIHHFAGGPGVYGHKIYNMNIFINNLKNINFNNNINNYINNENIINKSYSWQNSSITFLENNKMNAFGYGDYVQLNSYNKLHFFIANFGGFLHTLTFNNDYTEFTSIRNADNEIVKGKLL